MKCGVAIFPTEYTIDVPTLANAVEERGFESLFFPEHTHIPTDTRSPWPGQPELPEEYKHTLDPFVALAAAAAVTQRLLVGTAICLVVQRDPITLAKEVATLDHLGGGRFLFGVGAGWNPTELRHHGTDPERRWALLRERIAAMKVIWGNDIAEYHGELVDFDPLWQWPKPHQSPHPPILVGGHGPHALQRVVDYGDEWLPMPSKALPARITELQALAAHAGRDPIPVTLLGAEPDPERLHGYAAAGVHRCLFFLTPGPASDVLAELDHLAVLANKLS